MAHILDEILYKICIHFIHNRQVHGSLFREYLPLHTEALSVAVIFGAQSSIAFRLFSFFSKDAEGEVLN